ncbi:MAG: S8 family serine peptidase [Anaerolineales bacterium]|nr:S8 family serine peptidase [Anaerolineales bacterium]
MPCDDAIDGFPPTHGSHTTGTMVGDATAMGDTLLGMAPDAKWIGCRNMQDGFGTPASYTTCFEFFFAPYPQGGDPQTDGDVTRAPHVINNSWGCPPSEGCDVDTLRQVVENVRAGGIFVAASAGNEGWGGACSTIANPIGLYDASFTVGAHDSSGSIADFSSRGPVTADGSNRLKPDISAPGVSVRSIGPADGIDNWMSGTSMASPHVAGAVALLWSAVPVLRGDIDRTEQILIRSARPAPSAECESSGGSPNNVFGYGWLDVAAAIKLAATPVTLTVKLRDAGNLPLTGVAVRIMDKYTRFHYPVQVTDPAGVVQWNPSQSDGLLFAGDYAMSAGCAGFVDEKNVSIKNSRTVTVTVAPANARVCMWFPELSR